MLTTASLWLTLVASAPARDVAVEVHATDDLGEPDVTLEQQLQQRLQRGLADHDVTASHGPADDRIVVEVRHTDLIDYEVEVHIYRGNELVEPAVEPFVCSTCRVVELYARVLDCVPSMVHALEPAPAALNEPMVEVSTTSDTAVPASVPSRTPPEEAHRDEPRVLGPLGIGGVVVAAAGLGLVTYGAVQISRGETVAPDDDERFAIRRDYAGRGAIWLTAGMGTSLAGAAMLAINLTVGRRQRARRVTVRPSVAPSMTGATIHGRF